MRPFVRLAASASAALLLATACTGGGHNPKPTPTPTPTAPALAAAWQTPVPSGSVTEVDGGYVVEASDGVTQLSTDGRIRWSTNVPVTCGGFSKPNAHGDVAYARGKDCTEVVLLDGASGKERWHTTVALVNKQYDHGDKEISVGDTAVTAVQFCGQVTRLAVKDGKRLGVISPADRKCANKASSDGKLLFVWHDPEGPDTPDDHGTGWIPVTDGYGAFELYDADSGKLLWRREASRRGTAVSPGAVVSDDPLVLASTESGHGMMRRYTRTSGKPGAWIGPQLPTSGNRSDGLESMGVADGVLVGTLDGRVYGIDITSGKTLWNRKVAGTAALGPDGVVAADARRVRADDGSVTTQTFLSRWDLHTGKDAGVYGSYPGNGRVALVRAGQALLRLSGKVAAVTLPQVRAELVVPADAPGLIAPPAWAAGEIRPDPLRSDCPPISDATLRLVGLNHSVGLPAPANCDWSESEEPSYSMRQLTVRASVAEPADVSASAVAKKQLRDMLNPPYATSTEKAAAKLWKPLTGVGDEAFAKVSAAVSGHNGSTTSARLIVRVRNLVVDVDATGEMDAIRPGSSPPSLDRLEAGVLAAANAAFRHYGLSITAPATPADGRYTKVPDVCVLLAADAKRLGLTEVSKVTLPDSGPRTSSCDWTQDADRTDELTVHAFAAAGSPLSGATGPATAATIFSASRQTNFADDAKLVPLAGVGQQAAVDRWDYVDEKDKTYRTSTRTVTVLDDNLVIQVEYARFGARVGAETEHQARAIAQKILTASGR